MFQAIQVLGSLLILAGFIAAQRSWLDPQTWAYLWLNLVGSGILAVQAAMTEQWGFLLLEAVWALVSLIGIVQKLRGRRS
jgi:hypothetical protein